MSVLFGGWRGQPAGTKLADTWEWDGVRWSQRCDGDPPTDDLETTPARVAELPMNGPVLAHANHFVDPGLARGCDRALEPSTRSRYRLANQHANRFARITDPVSTIKATLTDRTLPNPISKVAEDSPGEMDSGTVASIVMDLSHGDLEITRGPPHKSRYVELDGVRPQG